MNFLKCQSSCWIAVNEGRENSDFIKNEDLHLCSEDER